MPPGFQLPSTSAGRRWSAGLPLQLDPATDRGVRGWHFLEVVGRLRAGVSVDDAAREVSALMRGMLAALRHRVHRRVRRHGDVGAARSGGRRPAGDPGAARRGGAAAPHRLRQRRRPAARAVGGAPARDRAPHRARRRPRAAGAPAADRERCCSPLGGGAARAGGSRSGASAALVLAAPASMPAARRRSRSTAGCSRSPSPSPCSPACSSGWRPRCTRCAANLTARARRRRARRHGGPVETAVPARPGRRAGRARPGAGDRRGSPGAELPAASRQVDPGFDPERAADRPARALAGRVRRTTAAARLLSRAARPARRRSRACARPAPARALPMTGRLEIGDWSFVLEGRAASPPLPTDWHPADWQVVSPGYFETMGCRCCRAAASRPSDRTGRARRDGGEPHARPAGLARRRRHRAARAARRRRRRLGLAHGGGHRGRRAASRPQRRAAAGDVPALRPVSGRHGPGPARHVAGAPHVGRPGDARRPASRGASRRSIRTCRSPNVQTMEASMGELGRRAAAGRCCS